MAVRSAGGRQREEEGSGLVSSWFGVLVFLVVLLAAVQVLLNLFVTSMVGSAAYDAARLAAAGGADSAAMGQAEDHARRMLGRFGDEVRFDWTGSGSEEVVLRVQARAPGVMPAAVRGPVAFGDVDRTVRVRVETFR